MLIAVLTCNVDSIVDFPVLGCTWNVHSIVDFPVPGYTCNVDSSVESVDFPVLGDLQC